MQQNYAAVIELLDKYYDGLYYGDTALLRDVFHPKARYVTVSGGQLLQLDMASYFPIVEARTSPQQLGEPYGFQIDSLELTPAFAGQFAASVLDQYPPHRFSGRAKEVPAAIPVLSLFHINEPDIGVMHECRRL